MRLITSVTLVTMTSCLLMSCDSSPTTFTPNPELYTSGGSTLTGTITVVDDETIKAELSNRMPVLGLFEGGKAKEDGKLLFGLSEPQIEFEGAIAHVTGMTTDLPKVDETGLETLTLLADGMQQPYKAMWTIDGPGNGAFIQKLKPHCGASVDIHLKANWNYAEMKTKNWQFKGPDQLPIRQDGPVKIVCP